MGQIRTFSDQQNVLKSDLKKSRICSICGQSDPFWVQIWSPRSHHPQLLLSWLCLFCHYTVSAETVFGYIIATIILLSRISWTTVGNQLNHLLFIYHEMFFWMDKIISFIILDKLSFSVQLSVRMQSTKAVHLGSSCYYFYGLGKKMRKYFTRFFCFFFCM